MQNINEIPVSGKRWIRTEQVVIDNPYNGMPHITFIEKKMSLFSDGSVINEPFFGGLSVDYQAGVAFPLINPVDGTPLGSNGSTDQLMVLLTSYYAFLASQRTV
jgi:hypothetical protein